MCPHLRRTCFQTRSQSQVPSEHLSVSFEGQFSPVGGWWWWKRGRKMGKGWGNETRNYWAQRALSHPEQSSEKSHAPFSCQLYFLAQHLVSERPRLSVNASVLGKRMWDANLGCQALATPILLFTIPLLESDRWIFPFLCPDIDKLSFAQGKQQYTGCF